MGALTVDHLSDYLVGNKISNCIQDLSYDKSWNMCVVLMAVHDIMVAES